MTSLAYDSCLYDAVTGAIDFDSDTFYMVLVTSSYTPNKKTHTKRSDVTNEVVGAGYTAGGAATSVTVTNVTASDQITIAFGAVAWPTSTITARAGVIYKRRGGASSADELVAYVDFGSDKTSTADTFTATPSTPLTIQN